MFHSDGVNIHPLIMILLACNADGTNKLQPLVTGKSKNLHCFMLTNYVANKKACITQAIITGYLRALFFFSGFIYKKRTDSYILLSSK
jgi:hypothetical protein